MKKYHHDALVSELKKPEYDGKSAEEVFGSGRSMPSPKSLLRLLFVTPKKFADLSKRKNAPAMTVAEDATGFPNAIRPDEFQAAWKEARG